jgi:hypothetical protein
LRLLQLCLSLTLNLLCLLRGRSRNTAADFSTRAFGVLLTHDIGQIERLDLGCLVPGMAATRALERAALLAQQLSRNLEMARAVWTRDPHPHTCDTTVIVL